LEFFNDYLQFNDKFIFEIGEKRKSQHQIQGLTDAFIIEDSMELPLGQNLPLWISGFLYYKRTIANNS